LTAAWFGVQDTAQTVLGATGNFMVTFLYISPLATMVKVIRTRNAESIDPYFGAGQVRHGLTHPQALASMVSVLVVCSMRYWVQGSFGRLLSPHSHGHPNPQILNCILWSVYGLVLNDPLIYVVNIFGLLTGIVQYILLIMYWPGRTKKGVPSSLGVVRAQQEC
jgi:hypothetical protein